MKITIDEQTCEKYGFSSQEVLLLLIVKTSKIPVTELFEQLIQKKYVYFNNELQQTLPVDIIDEKIQNVLLDSELAKPEINRFEVLAGKLTKIFPEGRKESTSKYWRGNKKKIAKKLEKFCKLYGKYTDDEILEAAQHYVDSFNGNYTYMRLLEYFIIKDVRKMGEEGTYVEQESELASCLENKGQDNYNNNWTASLK